MQVCIFISLRLICILQIIYRLVIYCTYIQIDHRYQLVRDIHVPVQNGSNLNTTEHSSAATASVLKSRLSLGHHSNLKIYMKTQAKIRRSEVRLQTSLDVQIVVLESMLWALTWGSLLSRYESLLWMKSLKTKENINIPQSLVIM